MADELDSPARLFTIRIWSEAVDGTEERRGSVRDVTSGAFRNFLTWSDLTSFLSDQLDDDRFAQGEPS